MYNVIVSWIELSDSVDRENAIIDLIGEEHLLGSGVMLETNECDMDFEFATCQEAERAVKMIEMRFPEVKVELDTSEILH